MNSRARRGWDRSYRLQPKRPPKKFSTLKVVIFPAIKCTELSHENLKKSIRNPGNVCN